MHCTAVSAATPTPFFHSSFFAVSTAASEMLWLKALGVLYAVVFVGLHIVPHGHWRLLSSAVQRVLYARQLLEHMSSSPDAGTLLQQVVWAPHLPPGFEHVYQEAAVVLKLGSTFVVPLLFHPLQQVLQYQTAATPLSPVVITNNTSMHEAMQKRAEIWPEVMSDFALATVSAALPNVVRWKSSDKLSHSHSSSRNTPRSSSRASSRSSSHSSSRNTLHSSSRTPSRSPSQSSSRHASRSPSPLSSFSTSPVASSSSSSLCTAQKMWQMITPVLETIELRSNSSSESTSPSLSPTSLLSPSQSWSDKKDTSKLYSGSFLNKILRRSDSGQLWIRFTWLSWVGQVFLILLLLRLRPPKWLYHFFAATKDAIVFALVRDDMYKALNSTTSFPFDPQVAWFTLALYCHSVSISHRFRSSLQHHLVAASTEWRPVIRPYNASSQVPLSIVALRDIALKIAMTLMTLAVLFVGFKYSEVNFSELQTWPVLSIASAPFVLRIVKLLAYGMSAMLGNSDAMPLVPLPAAT